MDIEVGLITKIIESDGVKVVINNKITPEFFYGKGKALYQYILRHYREYRKTPSLEVIQREFPDFQPEKTDEPLEYFIDQIRQRHKYNIIVNGLQHLAEILNGPMQNVDEAEVELYRLASRISTELRLGRDLNYAADAEDRIERYIKKKAFSGVDGIPIHIVPIDNITGGAHAGELITILGQPGTGKCVAWDSIIVLPRTGERITVEEFIRRREPEVLALNQETGRLEIAKVAQYVDSGIKPVFEVVLQDGRQVKVTSEHPFLTVDGWKNVKDLTEKDFVAVPKQIGSFGSLHPPEQEIRALAYLVAEGGLTTGHITFTNSDPAIISDFMRVCEYFDTTVSQSKCNDIVWHVRGFGRGRYNKNRLRDKAAAWGLLYKKSSEKTLPDEVFNYDEPSLKLLLGILWSCDGYVSKEATNCSTVSFGVSSRILAEQVFHLLHKLGFNPTFRCRPEIPAYEVTITHSAELKRFAEEIPLIGAKLERVKDWAKLPVNSSSNLIPMTDRLIEKLDAARINAGKTWADIARHLGWATIYKSWFKGRRISCEMLAKIALYLGAIEIYKLATADVRWVKVKSIQVVGPTQVYDLAVEYPYQNFVVNDIIVHNTFFELIVARAALKEGYRVLFITKEMEPEQIAVRMDAVLLGFPFDKVRRGLLGDEKEKAYFEAVRALKDNYPDFIVSGDNGEGGVTAIQAKIEEFNPDLVIIDGSYLIVDEDGGKTQWERALNITRRLKRLARKVQLPVYNSTQAGRQVKRSAPPDMEDVAFTYSYAQDSDVIISVYRSEEMIAGCKLGVKLTKVRDGANMGHFILNWNFEDMQNFGTLASDLTANDMEDEEDSVIF